jgi:hypothetical protein
MHHLTPRPRRYVAKITPVLSARHRISQLSRSRWVIGAGLGPSAQSRRSGPGPHLACCPFVPHRTVVMRPGGRRCSKITRMMPRFVRWQSVLSSRGTNRTAWAATFRSVAVVPAIGEPAAPILMADTWRACNPGRMRYTDTGTGCLAVSLSFGGLVQYRFHIGKRRPIERFQIVYENR